MNDYPLSDLARRLVRDGCPKLSAATGARVDERPAARGTIAQHAGVVADAEGGGEPHRPTAAREDRQPMGKGKGADAEAPASWVTTRAMTDPTPGSAGRVLQLVIDNSRDGRRHDPTKRTAPRSLRPSLVLVKG